MPPEITEAELTALKAAQTERDALKAENEKLKSAPNPKKDEDEGDSGKKKKVTENESDQDDLREKARKEREDKESKGAESKRIENALKFNLSIADFVKQNADALPNEIPDILKTADKENYDSAIQRASAMKKSIIEAFFAVQQNVDLLTTSQKSALDDYLKLTKNGKEQKAEAIYENLFEPAIETLKKVKKAEELGKARHGLASGSKVEEGYKARLIAHARKTHLNEKEGTK